MLLVLVASSSSSELPSQDVWNSRISSRKRRDTCHVAKPRHPPNPRHPPKNRAERGCWVAEFRAPCALCKETNTMMCCQDNEEWGT